MACLARFENNVVIEVSPSMLRYRNIRPVTRYGGGKRGVIKHFSRKSRARMVRFLHSISFCGGVMITLTYPAVYPVEGKVYHGHLNEFLRQLRGVYRGMRVVWKLEYQKRGAPHFHLLLLDVKRVNLHTLSAKWYGIVGSGDKSHLACGLDVKSCWDGGGVRNVAAYVCKYLGKLSWGDEENIDRSTGRFWGYRGMKREKIGFYAVEANLARTALEEIGGLGSDFGTVKGIDTGKYNCAYLGPAGSIKNGLAVVAIFQKREYNSVEITQ